MGWICLNDVCKVSDDIWNGDGLAYYSISDDIKNIHEKFFEYIFNMTPGMIGFIVIISLSILIFSIFLSIRRTIESDLIQ